MLPQIISSFADVIKYPHLLFRRRGGRQSESYPFQEIERDLFVCVHRPGRFWWSLLALAITMTSVVSYKMKSKDPIEYDEEKQSQVDVLSPMVIMDAYVFVHLAAIVYMLSNIWTSFQKRTYVIDAKRCIYEFYVGQRFVHRGPGNNVYIRLLSYGTGSGPDEKYYSVVVNGFNLERLFITGLTRYHLPLRAMGVRLAARLDINYFDVDDCSSHHVVRHRPPGERIEMSDYVGIMNRLTPGYTGEHISTTYASDQHGITHKSRRSRSRKSGNKGHKALGTIYGHQLVGQAAGVSGQGGQQTANGLQGMSCRPKSWGLDPPLSDTCGSGGAIGNRLDVSRCLPRSATASSRMRDRRLSLMVTSGQQHHHQLQQLQQVHHLREIGQCTNVSQEVAAHNKPTALYSASPSRPMAVGSPLSSKLETVGQRTSSYLSAHHRLQMRSDLASPDGGHGLLTPGVPLQSSQSLRPVGQRHFNQNQLLLPDHNHQNYGKNNDAVAGRDQSKGNPLEGQTSVTSKVTSISLKAMSGGKDDHYNGKLDLHHHDNSKRKRRHAHRSGKHGRDSRKRRGQVVASSSNEADIRKADIIGMEEGMSDKGKHGSKEDIEDNLGKYGQRLSKDNGHGRNHSRRKRHISRNGSQAENKTNVNDNRKADINVDNRELVEPTRTNSMDPMPPSDKYHHRSKSHSRNKHGVTSRENKHSRDHKYTKDDKHSKHKSHSREKRHTRDKGHSKRTIKTDEKSPRGDRLYPVGNRLTPDNITSVEKRNLDGNAINKEKSVSTEDRDSVHNLPSSNNSRYSKKNIPSIRIRRYSSPKDK